MEKGDPEIYKAAGAVAGAILPLIYVRPINLRDAIGRFIFASICGYAFYFVAIDWFKWPEIPNRIMAGAIIAGAISWFIAGAVITRYVKQVQEAKVEED